MSQPYSANRRKLKLYVQSTIGANIRRIRLELKFTQADLSRLLVGSNESYFRSIENGQKDISLTRVVEIADILGVSVAVLLEGV